VYVAVFMSVLSIQSETILPLQLQPIAECTRGSTRFRHCSLAELPDIMSSLVSCVPLDARSEVAPPYKNLVIFMLLVGTILLMCSMGSKGYD
jgi:hypothetical protein